MLKEVENAESWEALLARGKNQNKPPATGYTYSGVYKLLGLSTSKSRTIFATHCFTNQKTEMWSIIAIIGSFSTLKLGWNTTEMAIIGPIVHTLLLIHRLWCKLLSLGASQNMPVVLGSETPSSFFCVCVFCPWK